MDQQIGLLTISITVVQFFLTLSFFYLRKYTPVKKTATLALIGALLTLVCTIALLLRGFLNNRYFSLFVNLGEMLGYSFYCLSIYNSVKLKKPIILFEALAFLMFLITLYFFIIRGNIVLMRALNSYIVSIVLLKTGASLIMYKDDSKPESANILAQFILLAGLYFIFRGSYRLFIGSNFINFMRGDYFVKMSLIMYSVISIILTFSIFFLSFDLMMAELLKISIRDPLTNLYNRRFAFEQGEILMIREQRNKKGFCLAILDLDNFKSINDSFGHDMGDEVLRFFADLLQNNLRESDLISRYGGEEFLIILPESSLTDSTIRLEYILDQCRKFANEGFNTALSFSAGIVQLSKDDTDLTTLISRADELLFKAKHNGKNQIQII